MKTREITDPTGNPILDPQICLSNGLRTEVSNNSRPSVRCSRLSHSGCTVSANDIPLGNIESVTR